VARVLVLTDLSADDQSWKGPVAWQIILSLVQSQHEVRVLMPRSNQEIPFTHPLLTVVQPVTSWRLDQLPSLLRAVIQFRPDILQTFAPMASQTWPAMTVWPFLTRMAQLTPRLRRVSTLFDEHDCRLKDGSYEWHRSADVITLFSQRHQARLESRIHRATHLLPLELPSPHVQLTSTAREVGPTAEAESTPRRVLVPAPVSEWRFHSTGLEMLVAFQQRHPECETYVLGGWGSWTPHERKIGWKILEPIGSRVHLVEDLRWSAFRQELSKADTVWMETLSQESWRYLLTLHLARQENRRLFLPSEWTPSLTGGSTANFLSRLYAEQ